MGAWRYMWIAVAAAALYCGWQFAARRQSGAGWVGQPRADRVAVSPDELAAAGHDVRIVQFYARDGVLTEGGDTVVCYDVVNARAVRLDPPVSEVWPSRNHCLSVQPVRDTRYTLTAEGLDGRTVSESFQVRVAPDAATLPKITSFRIDNCKRDYLGHPVFRLSFSDQNSEMVSLDPPVMRPLHGAPFGQFYVSPDQTTTYTLTVTGKSGHVAQQKLTVDVAACR